VAAFDENNFGSQRAFYANMWWVDDNIREIRKYLVALTDPGSRVARSHRRASVRFHVMSPFVSGITTDLSNALPFQRYWRSSCWSSLAT
jgi:hypothetical protein